MFGLEGSNILIAVGGGVAGVSVTVLSFLIGHKSPVTALCYGIVPAILGLVYVFTLRERRPRSYDRDLLETFLAGRSWQSKPTSKPHPLFFICFSLILPISIHAQFVPSQYADVRSYQDYEFTLIRDEPYGISVGESAAVIVAGGAYYQFLEEKENRAKRQESKP